MTDPIERHVRELLWMNHGCQMSALYGDDGELQCNAETCRMDFKRDPLPGLIELLMARGRLHAGLKVPSVPVSALRALLKEWQDTGDSMQALIDLELLCERAIDAQEPTP